MQMRLSILIASCVLMTVSSAAEAQVRAEPVGPGAEEEVAEPEPEPEPERGADSQRSGERPFYVSAGAGVSIGLDAGTRAKLELVQEIGYHFLPIGEHPGVFGALTLAQAFIEYSILQFGVRVGIDFALASTSSFTILVSPSAASGLGLYVIPSSVIGTETRGYFDIQLAGDVKLSFGDGQIAVWLRPVSFDFFINGLVLTRYDVLGGVQVSF